MAKIDDYDFAFEAPPKGGRRRWHTALTITAVILITGSGAIAMSVMHGPTEEALTEAEPATARKPTTPEATVRADVTQAQPGEILRASKSDPLPLWSRRKQRAPARPVEPDPPIAAARQVVALNAPEARPQASPPMPRIQQHLEGFPAPAAADPNGTDEPEPDSASAVEPVEASEPQAADATQTAPVKSDVNMRARPDNAAAVITVVPGGSRVEVIDCDYWCEVDFSGKRGWIYKSFIRGAS